MAHYRFDMTKANPHTDCRACGKTYLKPHKRSVFCGPECAVMHKTKVGGGCWLWTGCVNNKGYGLCSYGGARRQYVHRMMLEIKLGRPIARGLKTLHSCDNPRCVNPAHLSEGTQKENLEQAVDRGRLKPSPPRCLGERHGSAKLTVDAVHAIRASDETSAALAARFGVGRQAIDKVRKGERWSHV